jgi:hypothetical protein
MSRITLQISLPSDQQSHQRVREVLSPYQPYLKGTDLEWYVDFQDRATAHLRMVNLNQLPGVKAKVFGE